MAKKKKVEAPVIEETPVVEEVLVNENENLETVETVEEVASVSVPEVVEEPKPIEKEKSIEEKIIGGKNKRLEIEKIWKKKNNISDSQTNLFSYGINSIL